tara:strand:+ start:229 stop:819 length:591 start_codon:yes stop_codon:yes gene_type:complete
MPLLTTKSIFGYVNTISIPTDAILIVSLLIVFLLLGYFFNNILNNETNKFAQKIYEDSNLEIVKEKLEDQLTLDTRTNNEKTLEGSSIKKLNLLANAKLLGLGSLALVAMGGASLLGVQSIQKSYEGLNTGQANIKLENQSTKSQLSVFDLIPFNKTQTNIKKISYNNSLLTPIKSSKYNRGYKIKAKKINNNFSF